MKRPAFFAYSVVCHVLFLITYAALALFVGGFWAPFSIDGAASDAPYQAALIDSLLIVAFGLQHSVMARPAFKAWWTRFIPAPIERSTYVLASCVATWAIMLFWQPIGFVVWKFESGPAWWALTGLFAFGWLMVPAVSLMINHFDLFGTRQGWLYLHGRDYEPLPFATPGLYHWVRHPLYVGWAIAFWATPVMTAGHALLATLMCGYMVAAVGYEERDLIAHFGQQYLDYMERAPRFWPRLTGAQPETAQETAG